jgi:hypothetical protein
MIVKYKLERIEEDIVAYFNVMVQQLPGRTSVRIGYFRCQIQTNFPSATKMRQEVGAKY